MLAGRRQGRCKEEQVETADFTNVYEETKYHGERMISQVCYDQGNQTQYIPAIHRGMETRRQAGPSFTRSITP